MKLIWNGPLLDPSGYGYCSREYVQSLIKNEHTLYLDPVRYFIGDPKLYLNDATFNMIGDHLIPDNLITKDWTHIEHKTPGVLTSKKCKLNIGYTVWETDRMPHGFANTANEKDMIWTASEFSKQSILNSGVHKPVKVIPHIIPTNKFVSNGERGKTLVFLFNGEFTYRKGVDVLLKAFMYAFQNHEDVLLILKTYILDNFNYQTKYIEAKIGEWQKELDIQNRPKIKIINQFIRDDELPKLYNIAHVFVTATRGEGFGLPIAEAMSSRLLTIAPSIGGHRDFCTPDNCFLIDSEIVDIPDSMLEPGRQIYRGQKWVEPSFSHLVYLLRGCYDSYDFQIEKRQMARETILNHCNENKIVSLMEESIDA